MKEIVSKDSLYEPMKTMRDEYPKWLEENHEKIPFEELENYNKQLDLIELICKKFEQND
jgi:peroxin-19